MKIRLAILLTCYNRKNKTLACLNSLVSNRLPEKYHLDIFLVDDGSTDGTTNAVKKQFPMANIIKGDGKLYWNKGMRLAWETAVKKRDYDFFVWLNDDTILDHNSLQELLDCYVKAVELERNAVIITGTCRESYENEIFSYGGRSKKGPVIPNGKLQTCTYINGNAVLIPKEIYNHLGNLSPDYTHAMGDFDYGLRAQKKGFTCYITKKYIATCTTNNEIPGWCNPKNTIIKRWKLLYSPKGLNIKEYKIFRKRFWKRTWFLFILKAYLKALFPIVYNKIVNELSK